MRTKDANLLNSIKEFVEQFCNDRGRGPTVREVMSKFKMSVGSAYNYLSHLTEEGVLAVGASNRYEIAGFEYDQATANIEMPISLFKAIILFLLLFAITLCPLLLKATGRSASSRHNSAGRCRNRSRPPHRATPDRPQRRAPPKSVSNPACPSHAP